MNPRAAPDSGSPAAAVERYFAPCPRGLEAALGAELATLGAADVAAADGGVLHALRADLTR